MEQGNYTIDQETWSTENEIDFLSNLFFNNLMAFEKYADIIRQGLRRWDAHMDVAAIQAHITQLQKIGNPS